MSIQDSPKRNTPRNLPLTIFWFLFAGGATLGLIFLQLPVLDGHPEPGRRTECKNNLKQIGLALHNYHDEFGCLPPAYVADAQGKPLYSWRVLLLPSLEQGNLYKEFKLDEPWDSPHNIKLSNVDLPSFRCASDPKSRTGGTNYVAISGLGTAFEGTKPHTFRDIKDGTSQTLLVVEVADSDFHWAEPRDLNIDTMNLTIPTAFPATIRGELKRYWAMAACECCKTSFRRTPSELC